MYASPVIWAFTVPTFRLTTTAFSERANFSFFNQGTRRFSQGTAPNTVRLLPEQFPSRGSMRMSMRSC